jgi:hypothetical protein
MEELSFRDALSPDDLVRMHLLDPESKGRSNVRILFISVDRIEVISPISVLPGALIQLLYHGTFVLGEARCCHAVGSNFQIGVAVHDAFLTHPAGSFHPKCEKHPISLKA